MIHPRPNGLLLARATALAAALLGWGSAALADQTLEGLNAPLIRVNVKQGAVTIRTWDRPAVQVEGDSSLVVERKPGPRIGPFASFPIPAVGGTDGENYLPAESFVPGPTAFGGAGSREVVIVRSEAGTTPGPVTVTVPSDTALVFAFAHEGRLEVHNYNGTLLAIGGPREIVLDRVGGTVFAQTGRGPIIASDSTFDRIRARSLAGNITFERCTSRQIETSSLGGSIVYDGGSFQPGLATFSTMRGDVAIGSEGPAQISGHAGNGRVLTSYARGAQVSGGGTDAQALVGGGGPVVNASSQSGNVYLYDGSLRTRTPSSEWEAPAAILRQPSVHREPAGGGTGRRQPDAHSSQPQQQSPRPRGKFRWFNRQR